MRYLSEYRRMIGLGPSLATEASEADPLLGVLTRAFSTPVKQADVKFIRYRKAKHGVELEDRAERLGGILTSVENREADSRELIVYLKKHGAKSIPEDETNESVSFGEGETSVPVHTTIDGVVIKGDMYVDGSGMSLTFTVPMAGETFQVTGSLGDVRAEPKLYPLNIPRRIKRGVLDAVFKKAYKALSKLVQSQSNSWLKLNKGMYESDESNWVALQDSINTQKVPPDAGEMILQRMGGAGRIRAMTNASAFLTYPNGVSFKFPNRLSSRGNYVKITLMPEGTCTMEFFRIVKYDPKPVKKYSGVPIENLISVFEKQTELRIAL